MPLQRRIRVPAIVIAAFILIGCSTAPTVTPSPNPTAPGGPTTAPSSGPSASPGPSPVQVAFFRELPFAPETSLGYGPVRAIRDEFVITGSDASGASLVWYGDSTATTWRLLDASAMEASILDIAAGPAGWLAVTQGVGEAAMGLWSSPDGRSWRRYLVPGFEQANSNSIRLTIGASSFTVAAQLSDGRSLLYTSADGRTWTVRDQAPGLDFALVTPVGDQFLAAFGGEPDGGPFTLEVSPDQTTWTPIESLGDTPPTLLTSLQASAGGVIGLGTE
ncbi:MAG TPA: hypothetical protein VNH13_09200, partial [Candidatus Acidoferrales bacterium]|nr:hypothetical protein [Candidatus Acidoferrales bacterium]